MLKSHFPRASALALAAILALGGLSLATDALAARGGGGGHGGGGGGHHVGGFRSGAAFRTSGFRAHPGFAIRHGTLGVHRGVAFHRFVHRRFVHRGFGFYPSYTYSCYRWRHILTPFGWRLRRVNVCYPYYGQYYY